MAKKDTNPPAEPAVEDEAAQAADPPTVEPADQPADRPAKTDAPRPASADPGLIRLTNRLLGGHLMVDPGQYAGNRAMWQAQGWFSDED